MPYAQVILASKESEWQGEVKGILYPNIHGSPPIDPLRLTATATEGRDAELNLEINHALYDAEAISKLLLEIQDSYYGLDVPPAPSFQRYLDYAAAIDTEAQAAFWHDQLHRAAP
ncbi:MAG: hypothetical protein M1823_007265, partial [Watsoniomyces obsoletus]